MAFIADHGASVILSSHLVSDLERVCDYLIVLVASRVRIAGEVDDLLATHHRVTGARRDLDSLLAACRGDRGKPHRPAVHADRAQQHPDRRSSRGLSNNSPSKTSCWPTWPRPPPARPHRRIGDTAMIWFTWRQFRTPAWITVGALAVIAVVLAVSRSQPRRSVDLQRRRRLPQRLRHRGQHVPRRGHAAGSTTRSTTSRSALMYVVPALIGIFWGAPLIARELETGTHRLAWNQSVTRTRWLATKLAIVGAATAATAGLLSWAVTAWAHHIDHATGNRDQPADFGARGIVPIGYALFAFVLGVTMGMLIRRTVPAMAATLAIYIGAVVSMPLWIRAHLAPVAHATTPLDLSRIDESPDRAAWRDGGRQRRQPRTAPGY